MTEKILITIEINDCFHCPFLNSSDNDCSILQKGIREVEWSNINFQFDDNWRYKDVSKRLKEANEQLEQAYSQLKHRQISNIIKQNNCFCRREND